MHLELRRFVQDDEDGATAIEYGLIAALICVVILAALSAVATETVALFNIIATNVDSAS